MAWFILAAAYLVIGVGVFAWCVRGDETTDSDRKRRSARVLVLFPELCLFWPIALFMKIKRKRQANTVADHPVE